jgi:hypothetical protein
MLVAAVVVGCRAIPVQAAAFSRTQIPRSHNRREPTFLRLLVHTWRSIAPAAVVLGVVHLRQDRAVQVRVVGVWAPNQPEPWWLAPNLLDPLEHIVALYGRRMTVEAPCRDTTGGRFGVRLEWTQFRTPASLARLTRLVGVALGRWTAVGQAVAIKAPRVRLVCQGTGPRLSLLRVGIQVAATLALLAYLGVRFIRAHLPLPSSAAFPGSKLLRRSHESAKRSAIQQSLSPSQKRHPTGQTR